ncbi:phosphoribosyl 1,2-cyclic phosphate phosphodiesterase [Verrucomicrobium sp. GAS474]|uniref:MBL fold metallo-hydrolase n=1 Tax=Verrucomicrobium sp. GAS474 TaxID=1882831 RepID=UPI000879A725|nr:MBL fold metallo-hydrolase [Verrucomicrobium sp. GAS474]SDU26444.1 phosphoribosyl 1,2-cyclic phosphate phosphodiesterase [Verrucomicrobium sp. GAS474]
MTPVTVTLLGSGTSQGVPMMVCDCAVCTSADPRDKRTRSSIYLNDGDEGPDGTQILVDTTPELRLQCIAQRVRHVRAVLFTHGHADHLFGFDDLRRFCELNRARMPVHASPETLEVLRRTYAYAFDPSIVVHGYVRADAVPFPPEGESFRVGVLDVIPLPVTHGRTVTHGFLFRGTGPQAGRKLFAYIPDCKTLPDATKAALRDVERLVIDGLRDEEHPTHMTIAEAIAAGREVGAGETILTHLTHHKSHADREAGLPPGVHVAYDGMRFTLGEPLKQSS